MTITNMAQMSYATRNLNIHNNGAAKSLRNITSGYRINSAADDAAGLAISEKMRGQLGGMDKAIENVSGAVALVKTAEGALNSSSDILIRMKELAVQSSNGTYSDNERALLNKEFESLKTELDGISTRTNYNGMNLLDGTLGGKKGQAGLTEVGIDSITANGVDFSGSAKFNITRENGTYSITATIGDQTVTNQIAAGVSDTTFQFESGNTITLNFASSGLREGTLSQVQVNSNSGGSGVSVAKATGASTGITFQVGANGTADQRISTYLGDMSSTALGLSGIDISTGQGALEALGAIESAANKVSGQRGSLGAVQNRLEHTHNNLTNSYLNLYESESKIRDANIAEEMMNYTKQNILMQASQAMMTQAMNLVRTNVLGLLMN